MGLLVRRQVVRQQVFEVLVGEQNGFEVMVGEATGFWGSGW